jgi:hypothetical protein
MTRGCRADPRFAAAVTLRWGPRPGDYGPAHHQGLLVPCCDAPVGWIMKTAVCERYGPPEVVQIRGVRKPVPADGEVLVKAFATTVNSGDARVRWPLGRVRAVCT